MRSRNSDTGTDLLLCDGRNYIDTVLWKTTIDGVPNLVRDREQAVFQEPLWCLSGRPRRRMSQGHDGNVDARLGDEKHIYGISFVIYAASKLRAVAADDLALKAARDAFDWLEAHAHGAGRGGYFEALTRDGTPIITCDECLPIARRQDRLGISYGFKTMNSHIHLLEALAELSRVDSRPIVTERFREVFQLVRDRIAVEPGALNLYLTRDWRAIPATIRSAPTSGRRTCWWRPPTRWGWPTTSQPGPSPAGSSIMPCTGAGTTRTAGSTTRAIPSRARRSIPPRSGGPRLRDSTRSWSWTRSTAARPTGTPEPSRSSGTSSERT